MATTTKTVIIDLKIRNYYRSRVEEDGRWLVTIWTFRYTSTHTQWGLTMTTKINKKNGESEGNEMSGKMCDLNSIL